ncbi:23493_t:CDS:2 [Gigaspora margarita]|uniref:23493_t:CDS:1 n=1 Tax=Gigaspora margarita TaxID=4874 RepID=A0ABN7VK28_GIGMA|nr:23493_t:CDS:2 [Gigaspora margarita]
MPPHDTHRSARNKLSSVPEGLAQDIDPQIKAYIDEAYQVTITTLIDKVKELINQQAEKQVGLIDNETNSRESPTSEEQNNQATPATINSPPDAREDQGNYPPISVINDKLIDPILPKNAKNELSVTRNKAYTKASTRSTRVHEPTSS